MATEVTWALATSMSWRTKAFRGAHPTANPDPIGCRSLVVLRFLVLQASDEPPSMAMEHRSRPRRHLRLGKLHSF
jgi:hypothetical protein